MNGILFWIAQGFGIGRVPFAPGTFGSALGLLWVCLLLLPGSLWIFLLGTIAGIVISVPLCSIGERVLHQKDPGSVVIDEIAAMPVCFLGWILLLISRTGAMPEAGYFVGKRIWPVTAGVFLAFRFFDVVKPWPVRQSQSLHAGLGVTVDDMLAAIYVNLVLFMAYAAGAFTIR